MFKLRDYQLKAVNEARNSFAKGNKKICLTLCTGAGKSPIAREIISRFREKNSNGKVAYLTFRTVLINQMKETLKGLDVEIGTLQKYGKNQTEMYDLVLIDEAHYAFSSKLQNNINAKYILGLSATPIDSYGNALEFDDIVDIVQLKDLIDMGFASPVKVLSNSNVDTSELKSRAGDFVVKEAYDLMSKASVQKNIVETYTRFAKGLKTIVYGVNIKHCEQLKDEFIKAGFKCDSVHSKKRNTDLSLQRFKDGEIDILVNADILTTGFDAPDIYCLILAAPTKSVIKAVQIYGRATRLNPKDPNKKALILDCAEVIKNTVHPLEKLNFSKKKQDKNKMCECGKPFKLINRVSNHLNEFEYVVISDYKCDCGATDRVENIKVINHTICESCNEIFTSSGVVMDQTSNAINFDLTCNNCGHKRKFREILLTNDELKEVKYNEAFKKDDWDSVKLILKTEAKKVGYHWKWTERCIEMLMAKYSATEAIDKIKAVLKSGKKIGSVMYV